MKNKIRKTIIVDLDGTLAIIDKRRNLSRKVYYDDNGKKHFRLDWNKFFNPSNIKLDEPNTKVINLVNFLKDKYNIVITSGRSDITKNATLKWLNKHKVYYDKIYMRKEGDRKYDDILKENMLHELVLPNFCNDDINNIEFVLDDRDQVVKTWRSLGLTCLQVAEGDF
tara:strand:- start:158 stop:661 length:504 start_codon:yes stop_codon:yes gene_type:complete